MERKKHTAEDGFNYEPRRNRYTDLIDKELEGLEGRAYIDRLTEFNLMEHNAFDLCFKLEYELGRKLFEKILPQMTDLRDTGRWPHLKDMECDQCSGITFDIQCGERMASVALYIARRRYIAVKMDDNDPLHPASEWLMQLEMRLKERLSQMSHLSRRNEMICLFGTTPFLVSALPQVLDIVEEMAEQADDVKQN